MIHRVDQNMKLIIMFFISENSVNKTYFLQLEKNIRDFLMINILTSLYE